jgi:hypothetical protein
MRTVRVFGIASLSHQNTIIVKAPRAEASYQVRRRGWASVLKTTRSKSSAAVSGAKRR